MLQQILGLRRSWAIATILAVGSSFGCGDDSGSADNDSAGKGGSSSNTGGKGGSGGSGTKSPLDGTGDKCQSYTAVTGDMCQGWFCGVTETQLKAAVDPKAKCGGDVALLCAGAVTKKVGECARTVKMANLDKENEELKPIVSDCVYEDAEIKEKVPQDCLDCTIDVAVCAAENCLIQCLGGDTPGCDTCRLQKNCDQQVFGCGGLPAPIK